MDGDKNNRNKKQKDELHLKKNFIYYIRFFVDNVKENHFYDKNALIF